MSGDEREPRSDEPERSDEPGRRGDEREPRSDEPERRGDKPGRRSDEHEPRSDEPERRGDKPGRRGDASGSRAADAPGARTTHAFGTRAVHAGLTPDPTYGSVIPPIHQTSTYAQRRPGEFVDDYDYARSANPTRAALERALGELEGGHAVAFASGLAAAHALITVTCEPGSRIVLPGDLYGGTYRLVDKVLARWGLAYELIDQRELSALDRAVREQPRLIWVESPTNPLLGVVDIERVVERRGQALVAVDNTFATPVNQRPLELGADFVVHSTTKYLGGHSDVVGGVVVAADREWYERLRFVQNAVGAVPGPLDCFLVHRGLRTLHLRMAAHARGAAAVVELLRDTPDVTDLQWPGYSGMVSFRHPRAAELASRTRLFTLAESLGGVESLIELPQAMTHQSVEGSTAAVPADLVRLSCGVEDPDDLVADLRNALS